MTSTPELRILAVTAAATLAMWIPYIGARLRVQGVAAALGNPDLGFPAGPAWAERARRAHANAVENLAVFAPLVIGAALSGISTPTTVLASKAYLGARLVHYAVYVAGVPLVRTLAFTVGFAATATIALAVLRG